MLYFSLSIFPSYSFAVAWVYISKISQIYYSTLILAKLQRTEHWFQSHFIVKFGRTQRIRLDSRRQLVGTGVAENYSPTLTNPVLLFFTTILQLCMTGIQIIKCIESVVTEVLSGETSGMAASMWAKIICFSGRKIFIKSSSVPTFPGKCRFVTNSSDFTICFYNSFCMKKNWNTK